MAAVELTFSGVLFDKYNRTTQNVVLIGEASLTGVGVGGGPMPPGSGNKPGIWPPGSGIDMPTHPIVLPPQLPPPTVWPPGPGIDLPSHPIVIPPGANKPGIVEWHTTWNPTDGWQIVGIVKPDMPHPSPA
jgi:hypothetical protein